MDAITALLLKNEYFVSVKTEDNYVEAVFPANKLINPQILKTKTIYSYKDNKFVVDGNLLKVPDYAVRIATYLDIYTVAKSRGISAAGILNLNPEFTHCTISDLKMNVDLDKEMILKSRLLKIAKQDYTGIPSSLHEGCDVLFRCLSNGGLL